jgi:hypothetical protein
VLIDDQHLAFNAVVDGEREAYHAQRKVVFNSHEGPGASKPGADKDVIVLRLPRS